MVLFDWSVGGSLFNNVVLFFSFFWGGAASFMVNQDGWSIKNHFFVNNSID